MRRIEGDLLQLALEGRFDVIVHGCNCFHTMGAGIAKHIARQFPEAYKADLATPKGDRTKLGTYSSAQVDREDVSFTVVNAYTQFNWRGQGRKADYDAIEGCFRKIGLDFRGQHIAYPMIGAGLAGGDWNVIENIIEECLGDTPHTLVVLT